MADWRAVMDAEAMEAGRANRYRELVLAICKVDGFEKPTPEAMSTAKATDESCFKKATSWANYLERTGKKLKKLKDHYESKYGKPFEDTAALAARKAERAAAAKKKMAAQGPLLSEDQRRSYQMLLNYMLGDEGKKMIRESIKEMAAKKPEYKDRIVHWYNNGKNLKARLPTMERLSKDDRKVIEQLFKLKRFLEQKRERDPGKEEKRSSKRPAEFAPDVHAAYLPWLNGLWPAAYASVDGRGSADEEALGTSATGGNANWIIGYVRETLDGRTGLGYALADEAGMRHAAPFRRSPLPAAKVNEILGSPKATEEEKAAVTPPHIPAVAAASLRRLSLSYRGLKVDLRLGGRVAEAKAATGLALDLTEGSLTFALPGGGATADAPPPPAAAQAEAPRKRRRLSTFRNGFLLPSRPAANPNPQTEANAKPRPQASSLAFDAMLQEWSRTALSVLRQWMLRARAVCAADDAASSDDDDALAACPIHAEVLCRIAVWLQGCLFRLAQGKDVGQMPPLTCLPTTRTQLDPVTLTAR